MKKLNSEIIKSFIQNYKDGLTSRDIGIKYGVSPKIVLYHIKKKGVVTRKGNDGYRKYRINKSFFDEIDCQEKAYFLGFLYADGCNKTTTGSVSLELAKQDKSILEIFSSLIYPDNNKKLQIRPGGPRTICGVKCIAADKYCLSIHSKHISERLNKLGR